MIAAYDGIDGETLDGLLPQPMSFNANEPAPPVTCYWLAEYEDGEFTGSSLDNTTCDPVELTTAG